MSNVSKSIYKQLDETLLKVDFLMSEVSSLRAESAERDKRHKQEMIALKKQHAEELLLRDTKIAALEAENKRLRDIIDKDSSNSSKPPSTDNGFKKLIHTRTKSGKKPGGQKFHKGIWRKLYKEPTLIVEHKQDQCACGGHIRYTDKYTAKQLVDIRFVADIVEHRAFAGKCTRCGKKHGAVLPQNLVNPVTYGDNLKAVAVLLSSEGCVSVNRITSMLNELTNGIIDVSEGTVINWLSEIASKAEPELQAIKAKLLASGVNHKDETPLDVGTSFWWLHVLCNKEATYYHVDEKRGKTADENMGVLPLYRNTLVYDHIGSLIGIDCTHAECNAHILRYLKAVIENQKRQWARDMTGLLVAAHRETIASGQKQALPPKRVRYYRNAYDKILTQAAHEFKADKSPQKDYNGDDMKLMRRLEKYKEEHLLFISRADVRLRNNLLTV